MTNEEAGHFIDNVLKEMFPKWEPTDWQVKRWHTTLRKCKHRESKEAFERWFDQTTRPGREPVLGIFNAHKVVEPVDWTKFEPVPLFGIRHLNDDKDKYVFYWNKPILPAPHECESMAENYRKRVSGLYEDDYIVIRYWEKERV